MRFSLAILILLTNSLASLSHTVLQIKSSIALQQTKSNSKPLSLIKIKELIQNPSASVKDAEAQDQAIAVEIRRYGVNFPITDLVITDLRKMGAGPGTIRALEYLRRNSPGHPYAARYKLPSRIRILVADFQGPEIKGSSVTELIMGELGEAVRDYPNIEVVPLGESISGQQGRKFASEKGKEHDGSMVVWGWYNTDGKELLLSVHFQMLIEPSTLLQFTETRLSEKQTVIVPLSDFFQLQIPLSKGVSYLTFFTLGLAHLKADDLERAANLFTTAILQYGGTQQTDLISDAYFLRATALLMHSTALLDQVPGGALEDLERVIDAKGNNYAHAYTMRCLARSMMKEFASASEDCEKAIKIKKGQPQFYFNLGSVYLLSGNKERAIENYKAALKLVEHDPDTILFHLYSGTIASLEEDYAQVITHFGKLISKELHDTIIFNLLLDRAAAYTERGQFDLAFADVKRALGLFPDGRQGYWSRGYIYYKKEDFKSAISNYNRAVELGLNSALLHVDLGDAYAGLDDTDQAINSYTTAIAIDRSHAGAYRGRGGIFLLKKDFKQAARDLDESIRLNPLSGNSHLVRGVIHHNKEEFREAIPYFDKAVVLMPREAEAYAHRGHNYKMLGQNNKAIEDFREVVKLKPQDVQSHMRVAALLIAEGQYNQVIKELTQTLQVHPSHAPAYLMRGLAYAAISDRKNAIADLTRVLELSSDPEDRKNAETIIEHLRKQLKKV
jgi:tetratricopeptide (TPR) repeat protein